MVCPVSLPTRAANHKREHCLQPQNRERNDMITPLVVTYSYHPSLPPLKAITQQHHQVLQLSQTTKYTTALILTITTLDRPLSPQKPA